MKLKFSHNPDFDMLLRKNNWYLLKLGVLGFDAPTGLSSQQMLFITVSQKYYCIQHNAFKVLWLLRVTNNFKICVCSFFQQNWFHRLLSYLQYRFNITTNFNKEKSFFFVFYSSLYIFVNNMNHFSHYSLLIHMNYDKAETVLLKRWLLGDFDSSFTNGFCQVEIIIEN